MSIFPLICRALAVLFCLGLVLALWGGDRPGRGYGPLAQRELLAEDGTVLAQLSHSQARCGPWLEPGDIPPWPGPPHWPQRTGASFYILALIL
jgi:hypothetical protein